MGGPFWWEAWGPGPMPPPKSGPAPDARYSPIHTITMTTVDMVTGNGVYMYNSRSSTISQLPLRRDEIITKTNQDVAGEGVLEMILVN